MQGIVYVDGSYVPRAHASVSMEDRGYQFADGIYEAIAVRSGVLLDGELHFDRLERSMRELDIHAPMSRAAMKQIIKQLLRKNKRNDGVIYMQITRGVAPRNHLYSDDIRPVMTMALMPAKFRTEKERDAGVSVITVPDDRWNRCDIKTIALLPNMLARNASHRAGAKEAWQMRGDKITEGSLSNAYIVTKDGVIRTHPKDQWILGGVRRHMTLQIARELQMKVVEEAFTQADIDNASEAFISSCSSYVTPVVKVNDKAVGDGKVGPVTKRIMEAFDEHVNAMIERGWVA